MDTNESTENCQEISNLNQFNKYGKVKQFDKSNVYTIRNFNNRCLRYVLLPNYKLLLLGYIGYLQTYWISETDVQDVKTNSLIINSILFDDFSSFVNIEFDNELYKFMEKNYYKNLILKNNISMDRFSNRAR